MKKIIEIIGGEGVGKTALIRAASHKSFNGAYFPHKGNSMLATTDERTVINVHLPENAEPITLVLSGSPDSKKNAVIFVFALDNEESQPRILELIRDFERFNKHTDTQVFVVGCKSDLSKTGKNSPKEFAEASDYPYWEVSAKNGSNVDALFQYIGACLAKG